MPFTPFHFGPSGAVSLPLGKYVDVPVFVLASVVVDIEPLLVMVYGLDYPLHGYCHTLLVGSLVGLLWGCVACMLRPAIRFGMKTLHLKYESGPVKMIVSGALGVWLHIFLDAVMHSDVRPFYPLNINPLHGLVSVRTLHVICLACFIPAFVVYVYWAAQFEEEKAVREEE